jgi:hypothetical protein
LIDRKEETVTIEEIVDAWFEVVPRRRKGRRVRTRADALDFAEAAHPSVAVDVLIALADIIGPGPAEAQLFADALRVRRSHSEQTRERDR